MAEPVSQAVRDQVAGWRRMVLVLGAAFFALIAVVCLYFFTAKATADRRDAITNCRSRAAAALSAAQVDNDIAFDDLVTALSDPARRPYTQEITRIEETKAALALARDARLAFEEHPSGNC